MKIPLCLFTAVASLITSSASAAITVTSSDLLNIGQNNVMLQSYGG